MQFRYAGLVITGSQDPECPHLALQLQSPIPFITLLPRTMRYVLA